MSFFYLSTNAGLAKRQKSGFLRECLIFDEFDFLRIQIELNPNHNQRLISGVFQSHRLIHGRRNRLTFTQRNVPTIYD
jgi:hypothetical protein